MKNRQENKKTTKSKPVVQLARHLTTLDATMIGVGAMIGAGIFVLTGIAIGEAGPAAVLAFGLNGIVTFFTALSYAELSSAIPEAGGGYSFVKKLLPNWVAFGAGWMLWFAYVVACSLYAKGFASYFLEFFGRYFNNFTHKLIDIFGHHITESILIFIIGIIFIVLNVIGTHASGRTEDIITIGKIIILGIFIYFGFKKAINTPVVAKSNFTPLFPLGFKGILAAMGLTFIAFEGYDLIATVSEEVKEPRKTIPKAIMYSLIITVIIYVLVVFVSIAAVPSSEGLPTWKLLGKYKETGIIRAAQDFMPKFGLILILAGGVFATLSALNATILASSRVAFAMGRDWMLPNTLSRIHSIRKTPVMAITVSGLLFMGIAIFVPIETVGTASSLLFLLSFTLVNISLLVYRKRKKKEIKHFKVPFFPVTPILGIITSLGLAAYQIFNEPLAWIIAIFWLLTGLFVYIKKFKKIVSVADIPKMIEIPELLRLKRTKKYKILVPLANPERAIPLIEIANRVAKICKGEILGLNVTVLPKITSLSDAEPFLAEGQNIMKKAQSLSIKKDIPFTSLLKVGRSAGSEIVNVARENNCNLILMGYTLEDEPLEHSVIQNVVSKQPCDIAILKSQKESLKSFNRVLLPIGGKIIHDRLKVRILHSISKHDNSKISLMISIPPDSKKNKRKWAQDVLQRVAKLYKISGAELIVEESEQTSNAIIKLAKKDDLLILGMREERSVKSLFFGKLSQQIAGKVECPILLTKAFRAERLSLKRLFDIT